MRAFGWVCFFGAALSACAPRTAPEDFVARVGDTFLYPSDVEALLQGLPTDIDSADAHTRVVQQWIERELLYQEAVRLDVASRPAVRAQLQELERDVLIEALMAPLFEDAVANLTDAELRQYYSQHMEHLRTVEPFVQVRHMAVTNAQAAGVVYNRMRYTPEEDKAVVFDSLAAHMASDPAASRDMAANLWPQRRLFANRPLLRQAMLELDTAKARVLAADSVHHYLEVVKRLPPGTVPKFEWIRDQLRTHSGMDLRKQLYATRVQRLRMEALARERLAVRIQH